ncbi:hypothetical protein LDENG_00055540 [Lucifuga dentata]|nr:hypothetical protein LDENG_00055540 [Lucifuga dentata]
MQPHILLQKLKHERVNPFIIGWFHSFLINRTQQVKVNNVLSEARLSRTGVSSPVLFTLYTNDCTSSCPENYTVKFSDDSAILGSLHKDRNPSGVTLKLRGL